MKYLSHVYVVFSKKKKIDTHKGKAVHTIH